MISSWKRLKASRRSKKELPGEMTENPVRAPTPPTITLSSVEVLEISSKVTSACQVKDQAACKDLAAKINRLAKESDTNKRCLAGSKSVLAAAFESFSRTCLDGEDGNVAVLEETLSALTVLFPLNGEALTLLASASSMRCMVRFLKSGDLWRRRNAVLVLRELVVCSQDHRTEVINVLSETEGAVEALFKLIKDPVGSLSATKAALVVIYHMITDTNGKLIQKFIDLGLVSLLVEMLVDAQRSVCEKALSVLDGICSTEYGRANACETPLTMPVIVKKILRVSDMATELSVSIMWKLCKSTNEKMGEDKNAFAEALQVGAFQKLLLLLQVGCGSERTKEEVSELLKLMNIHKDRFECSDGWIKSLKSF